MQIPKDFDFDILTRMFENERSDRKKKQSENPRVKLTVEEKLLLLLEDGMVLNVTNAQEASRGPGVKNTKRVAPNSGSNLRTLADEGYLKAVAFSTMSKSTSGLRVYLSRVLKFEDSAIEELIQSRFPELKKNVKTSSGLRKKVVEKTVEPVRKKRGRKVKKA